MPRVFLSYSHDSDELKERVHALADRLCSDEVTIILDRDMIPRGPAHRWPLWSEQQVKEADRVLMVCTAVYSECYEGNQPPGTRLGAACEAPDPPAHLQAGGFQREVPGRPLRYS